MRLRYILTALCLVLLTGIAAAQDSSIVTWTASSQKTAEKKFDIILKGQLKKGWHLYAKPDVGVGIAGLVINVKNHDVTADTRRC